MRYECYSPPNPDSLEFPMDKGYLEATYMVVVVIVVIEEEWIAQVHFLPY